MTQPRIGLRRADEDSIPSVVSLLEANDLPSADARSKDDRFYLASLEDDEFGSDPGAVDESTRWAMGGIEVEGRHVLLRSVAVRESIRGRGIGTALCDALESRAAAEDVATLSALTTTVDSILAPRRSHRFHRVTCGRGQEPGTLRGRYKRIIPLRRRPMQSRVFRSSVCHREPVPTTESERPTRSSTFPPGRLRRP